MNAIIGRALLLTDYIPLNTINVIDPAHVAMIRFRRNGKLISPGINRYVEIDSMDGVFEGDDVFDVYFGDEDHFLVLKKGKDEYRFLTYELDEKHTVPKFPNTDLWYDVGETRFDVDTKKVGGFLKTKPPVEGITFRTAIRPDGRRSVYAFRGEREGKKIDEGNSTNLGSSWGGSEARTSYPADYVRTWPTLGKSVSARMRTNFPIVLDGADGDIEYSYVLAPRIPVGDPEDKDYRRETAQLKADEDSFIASHNRKLKRSGRGLLDRFRRH